MGFNLGKKFQQATAFSGIGSGTKRFYRKNKSTINTAAAIAALYYAGPLIAAKYGTTAAGTSAATYWSGSAATAGTYAGTTALTTAYGHDLNRAATEQAQADADAQIRDMHVARTRAEQEALIATRKKRRLLAGRLGQQSTVLAGGSLLNPTPLLNRASLLNPNPLPNRASLLTPNL